MYDHLMKKASSLKAGRFFIKGVKEETKQTIYLPVLLTHSLSYRERKDGGQTEEESCYVLLILHFRLPCKGAIAFLNKHCAIEEISMHSSM